MSTETCGRCGNSYSGHYGVGRYCTLPGGEHDGWRFEPAAPSPREGTREAEVTVLRLCESEHLILRAECLYRFEVDPACERCLLLHKAGEV